MIDNNEIQQKIKILKSYDKFRVFEVKICNIVI